MKKTFDDYVADIIAKEDSNIPEWPELRSNEYREKTNDELDAEYELERQKGDEKRANREAEVAASDEPTEEVVDSEDYAANIGSIVSEKNAPIAPFTEKCQKLDDKCDLLKARLKTELEKGRGPDKKPRKKKGDKLRDMENPNVLGYDLDRKTLTPKRTKVNTSSKKDYGWDIVGGGKVKLVPSGKVVTLEEAKQHVAKKSIENEDELEKGRGKDKKKRKQRSLSVPEQHQLKIARSTMKMSPAGAKIAGGMNHEQAKEVIARLTGKQIDKSIENPVGAIVKKPPKPESEKKIEAKQREEAGMDKSSAGEGSRGGKVVGHTSSGKPIYEKHSVNFLHHFAKHKAFARKDGWQGVSAYAENKKNDNHSYSDMVDHHVKEGHLKKDAKGSVSMKKELKSKIHAKGKETGYNEDKSKELIRDHLTKKSSVDTKLDLWKSKYIKREGSKGHYKYTYKVGQKKQKDKTLFGQEDGPDFILDREGKEMMNFAAVEKKARHMLNDELKHSIKDAQNAMAANPEGRKAGYYADEVHVYAGELQKRKDPAYVKNLPNFTYEDFSDSEKKEYDRMMGNIQSDAGKDKPNSKVIESEKFRNKSSLVEKLDLWKSKYLKREGSPGNYKYTYKEGEEPKGKKPEEGGKPKADFDPKKTAREITRKELGDINSVLNRKAAEMLVDGKIDKEKYDAMMIANKEGHEGAKKRHGADAREQKVDKEKVLKEYNENEDRNAHSENYQLLAEKFGTPAEIKKMKEILKRNKKQGSTSKEDNDWMYENINPYHKKLFKDAPDKKEAKKEPKKEAKKEDKPKDKPKKEEAKKSVSEKLDLWKSKYIKREGGPGNYKYTYKEGEKKQSNDGPAHRLAAKFKEMAETGGFKDAIGKRIKDYTGQEWELVGQNDKHVPYFSKVVGGKTQSKQFTLTDGKELAQKLLDKKEVKPAASKIDSKTRAWVAQDLANDESSTDQELKDHFIKEYKMSKEDADFFVGQRKDALVGGVNWKLKTDKPTPSKKDGLTGATRMQIQNDFDKIKQVEGHSKALRHIEKVHGISNVVVNSSGSVVDYKKS